MWCAGYNFATRKAATWLVTALNLLKARAALYVGPGDPAALLKKVREVLLKQAAAYRM
jgi:hypothetical protein